MVSKYYDRLIKEVAERQYDTEIVLYLKSIMETQINLLKMLLDRKAKFKLDINNDSSLKEFEGLCREIESLKKSLKDLNFMEYGL